MSNNVGPSTRVKRPALVARDVKAALERGEKVVMAKILRKHGYSETVIGVPANVTETQAYKAEMDPYIARLDKHRTKVMAAMEKKDLNEEQYRTLSDASSKLTHDLQLLTGGKTENIGLEEDRKVLVAILAEIRND